MVSEQVFHLPLQMQALFHIITLSWGLEWVMFSSGTVEDIKFNKAQLIQAADLSSITSKN